jgi:hypothetical protein
MTSKVVLGKVVLAVLLFMPCLAFPQDKEINLGKFSFFLSPKILADGSITDVGAGLIYKDSWGGDLRFRYTNIEKNEEIPGTEDSLNAINEKFFEVFLLPAKYRLIDQSDFRFWAGAGLYYEYNKLTEKGFFNMPVLETLNPPLERVNSYKNDFSMHLFGPLLETGIYYFSDKFNISFSGGLVPIFILAAAQKMSIVPLLDPDVADYSQNTWGSPHFFLNLESTIFKYVNIMLLYDAAWLKYQFIDFDENMKWIHPERAAVTHSFKIETSFLYPFGNDMNFQIGYGYMLDFLSLDSAPAVSENKHYLILSTKKTGR